MNTTAKRLLVAAAVSIATAASANSGWTPKFYTHNTYSDRTVWITIYDLLKTQHLDYGCVAKSSVRTWTSGPYAYGSFYYIRGEVKEGKDCSGRTLCDTTVQVNPQSNEGLKDVENFANNTSLNWYIHANGSNCYWSKN